MTHLIKVLLISSVTLVIFSFTTYRREKNFYKVMQNKYPVGDLNGDGKTDTATLHFEKEISADGTASIKGNKVTIEFSSNIPPIIIEPTNSIYLEKTSDVNGDKRNELLVFSQWPFGFWNEVQVYSFKNAWRKIATGKAFIADEEGFKRRIIKGKNGDYFLISDQTTKSGDIRTVKVKVTKK